METPLKKDQTLKLKLGPGQGRKERQDVVQNQKAREPIHHWRQT